MINPIKIKKEITVKELFDLYENGKQRRYGLLFAVNGGAYTIATVLSKNDNPIGGLTLQQLSVGMILFTLIMVTDIFAFGLRYSDKTLLGNEKEEKPELNIFAIPGRILLILLGTLISAGWLIVGLYNSKACQ